MVADNGDSEEWIHLHFTWAGKPFEIDVAGSDRCQEALIYASTLISPFLEYLISRLHSTA